jgi:hypothetical protein
LLQSTIHAVNFVKLNADQWGAARQRRSKVKKKLLLASAVLVGLTGASNADVLRCGQARVWPAEIDNNPVVSTDVSRDPDTHSWIILHHMADGSIASRNQQYGIVDWPYGADLDDSRWTGNLLRDPRRNIHMVGMIKYTNQGVFYEEQVYNRAHGDRMETRILARCEIVPARYEPPAPPIPQGTILRGYPPAQAAPQPAPTPPPQQPTIIYQQAPAPAPVTVAPVIVIPGVTGAGVYPAPPAAQPAKPKEEAGS